MKKILSLALLVAAISIISCNNEKKEDKAEIKTETPQKVEDPSRSSAAQGAAAVTAHACGADCKDGNHVYAHNEIGHTCTDICGSDHACGTKCKNGQHDYVHGDSGHTCSEECIKM